MLLILFAIVVAQFPRRHGVIARGFGWLEFLSRSINSLGDLGELCPLKKDKAKKVTRTASARTTFENFVIGHQPFSGSMAMGTPPLLCG